MTVTALKPRTHTAPKRLPIARLCNSDLVAVPPTVRALASSAGGDTARRISALDAHSVRPIIIKDARRAVRDQIETLHQLAAELDAL